MNFLKKPYLFKRHGEPSIIRGYSSTSFKIFALPADVQTIEDKVFIAPDGSRSVQKLKVFCDYRILEEDHQQGQKADHLWFQGKWFTCTSSRLSENTPLRHWTAVFVECLEQAEKPGEEGFPGMGRWLS